jgi:hypothetical protein
MLAGISLFDMRWRAMRRVTSASLALVASTCFGFSEDLCWSYVTPKSQSGPIVPKPFNCWDMQCKDQPDGGASAGACVITGAATYVDAAVLEGLHARNSLHFDAVYLLARLQGLSFSDARKLAVYDEATDLGQYSHYDTSGQNVTFASDDIQGVRRTNFLTNGHWLHFVPWYRGSGSATESVLTYNAAASSASPYPVSERPLNHLRAWAFRQQNELCEFGLTQGEDATGLCFDNTAPKTLYWDLPILAGPHDLVDIRSRKPTPVEWQRVKRSDTVTSDCTDRNSCYDRSYSAKAGSIESLGIYLHALGDRLSHYHCSEGAAIATTWAGEGSPTTQADFYLYYPDICGTVAHAMFHYPESGQDPLPERSSDSIRIALQEIGQWRTLTGYADIQTVTARTGFPTAGDVEAVVALVGRAVAQGAAADRIAALCNIARLGYGFEWHDGSTDCRYEAGSAGAASTTSSASILPGRRAGSISGVDAGSAANLRLSARVIPSGEDAGQTGSVFVGARLPAGNWVFQTPAGFQWWSGGALPAYYTGILAETTIPILGGGDLSTLRGTEIFVGYGRTAEDMLSKGKVSRIGTVPKQTLRGGP